MRAVASLERIDFSNIFADAAMANSHSAGLLELTKLVALCRDIGL